jgi:hypothetical protein
MEHGNLDFDDPGLKRAIQRAWEPEQAPQRLRARVGRLIASAPSIDEAPPSRSMWNRWQGRVYALAAAAVLILGIGLLALYYQGGFEPKVSRFAEVGRPIGLPSKTSMPITVAQSMVATHTACGKLEDHHLVEDPDLDSFRALSVKLTSDLGFPVIARGLGGEWKFMGAGECAIGTFRGAHLLFVRGGEMVSVFSLPSSCMSAVPPRALFEGSVKGHPVAGFTRGGAVYAVVGSSPGASMTQAAVTSIRDSLFGQFEPASCGEGTDLTFDF